MKEMQGRATWQFAHMFASVADKHPRDNDEEVLRSVLLTMRCEQCNEETEKYIEEHPIERPLAQWTSRFHDSVNKRLGKKHVKKTEYHLVTTMVLACGLAVAIGYYTGRHSRTCEVKYSVT